MKKWLLMVPLIPLAITCVVLESFERYSEIPVCEEQKGYWGGITPGCPSYDDVLASDYRVRGGEVFWEDRQYFPEQACGVGVRAVDPNVFVMVCWLEMNGYARTVERRILTKLEDLSPKFKVLKGSEPAPVEWQQKQHNKYAVGEQGVYFEGRLLEGADPENFSVIFPLGDDEVWGFFSVARAGNLTFVGGKSLGNIDPALFGLLPPSNCVDVYAGCADEGLAQPFQAAGGVSVSGAANTGHADHQKLKVLAPCEVSEDGTRGRCWSSQKIVDSAGDKGVAAQWGKDVFFFHRYGVSKFIGAAMTDFYVFERGGKLYINSDGKNFRMLRGHGNFATITLSRK
jgi:hypothetical protein